MNEKTHTTDELVALWRANIRKAIRFKKIDVCNEPHELFGSRIGGEPYLEKSESWPRSANGKLLRLLFQLDFREFQHKLSCPLPFQLLTFYYNPNYAPLQDPKRVIRTYAQASIELAQPLDFEGWDPKLDHWHRLDSPVPMDDIPDLEDLEFLTGEALLKTVRSSVNTPTFQLFHKQHKNKLTTRLGGFPRWLNGYHLPLCKQCNQLMYQLIQVDQTDLDGLYLGAGACGLGHLLFCPAHPLEFAICVSPLS